VKPQSRSVRRFLRDLNFIDVDEELTSKPVIGYETSQRADYGRFGLRQFSHLFAYRNGKWS